VNNEALIQAIERFIVLFIIAGIGAVIANISLLNGVLTPAEQAFVPVFVALLDAILKLLGGATMPVNAPSAGLTKPDRPHWWAV
jgi:hypothetical protein